LWRARVCWPLLFAYVAHFVFLRDVWISTHTGAHYQLSHQLLLSSHLGEELTPLPHPWD
jgi:hypothetical protein